MIFLDAWNDIRKLAAQHLVDKKEGRIRMYKCTLCQQTFKHRHHGIDHLESNHFPNHYVCDDCGVVKQTKKLYNRHLASHKKANARLTLIGHT